MVLDNLGTLAIELSLTRFSMSWHSGVKAQICVTGKCLIYEL